MASTLNVTRALQNPGQEYPFTADAQIEEMEMFGDPIRFVDVEAQGSFIGIGTTISATANVTATVITRCARCLEEVVYPVAAELDAQFSREPDPDDPDQYLFEASTVDLTEALKDALVLELPFRFFCKEDCKGLCPKCGTNLNTGSCTCQKGVEIPNPFEALLSIVENNEEV